MIKIHQEHSTTLWLPPKQVNFTQDAVQFASQCTKACGAVHEVYTDLTCDIYLVQYDVFSVRL